MQASVVSTQVAAVVVHIWTYAELAAAAPVDNPTPSSMLAESTLSVDVDSPTTNYTSVNSRLYLIAGMTIGTFLIIAFVGGFYLRVRLQRARGATGPPEQVSENGQDLRPPRRNVRLTKDQFRSLRVLEAAETPEGHESDICAVCLAEIETGNKLVVLPCAHQYHYECIGSWLCRKSSLCPLCKTPAIEGTE